MTREPRSLRDRAVPGGVAAVAFLLAAAAPLAPLLGTGWRRQAVALVLLLAVVTVGVRRRTGSRWRPTLVGLAVTAAVAVALAVIADVPVPGESWVPTALRRLVVLVGEGMTQILTGAAPLPPSPGLTTVLVLGAGLLWLLLDLVALALRTPPAAGLLLLSLWAPVVAYADGPGPVGFVAGGATMLLLLAATAPGGRSRVRLRHLPGVTAGAALVAAAALVAGPHLSALPGWSSVDGPELLPGGPGGDGDRLGSDLDLRESLADRSGRVVLSYTSTTGPGGPLRLYTLTDFDGRHWTRESDPGPLAGTEGLLWPGPVQTGPGEPLEITIGTLRTTALPLPLEPRELRAPPPWSYAPQRDEVLAASTVPGGTTFQVVQYPRELTANRLQGLAATEVAGDREHLTVPDSTFAAEIAELARQITADADDPYSRAIALQSYLRNTTNFTYSIDLPAPVTDDAVWDFLTQRTGYCVQFATAFAVMARTLGLPTRVGVGYLPGRPEPGRPGYFAVTGQQAHAWPEVHFDGVGWVRFEPTPSGQAGPPPIYADPLADPDATAPEPEEVPLPEPTETPTPPPTSQPGPAPSGTGSTPWWPVLIVAAAVIVVLAARRRRSAPVVDLTDPEVWWAQLTGELAGLGVVADEATTPRALGRAVRGRQAEVGGADGRAGPAVDRLVEVVERNRWAPQRPEVAAAEMATWVDAALRPLREAQEAASGRDT